MNICVFCAIATKEQAAEVVHDSAEFICFLPLEQEVPGHTIIASKAHYQNLLDAPANLGGSFIGVCQHLAIQHRQASNAVGFNLLNANGAAAQQSVMHLHFHFLPRHGNDGINAWPSLPGAK